MHEVTLQSLAFGGDAVGHLAGKTIFVPYGVPGDRVRVRIVRDRSSYAHAELLEVLDAGPGRRQWPCPYFPQCGGCQWQQLDYPLQVRYKGDIVRHALRNAHADELRAPIAAPAEFGYRRRVRLHWHCTSALVLGYRRRRSHRIVDIDHCPLLEEPLQRALQGCRRQLGELRDARGTLVMLLGARREAHVSLRLERGRLRDPTALLADPIAGGLVEQQGSVVRFGRGTVDLAPPSQPPLLGSAAAFAQANAIQDARLRELVVQWSAAQGARVLELYAGIGNLTQALAEHAAELVAVESAPAAAKLLQRNAQVSRGRVEVLAQDAGLAIERLVAQRRQFDAVVLDPPREGCSDVVRRLAALGPRNVVYVACDPMTLARDLQVLRAAGFAVRRAQGQDMMPQTYHVEVVALLERTSNRSDDTTRPGDI